MKRLISKLVFPITGFAALTWFLIRVIPKPSRATYPCMRVAAPIASSFVIYILGLISSILIFNKAKKYFVESRFLLSTIFMSLGILVGFSTLLHTDRKVYANTQAVLEGPNQPIGTAKGIFPGRVVWIFDRDATNENCIPNKNGHAWFLSENNNQSVIDMMLSSGLQRLTGQTTDLAVWQAIFSFYNNNKGKGAVGYNSNEKIFIKINATSAWSGNFNPTDLSVVYNSSYGMSETSPQIVLAVLRQLVNVVRVPQNKIYIGDPMKHIYKHCYDMWHSEFPNVHYLDHSYNSMGREKVIASTTAIIHYSDNGQVLSTNVWDNYPGDEQTIQDNLYTIFEEAEYMINIPMLKGHKRAGITAFAKNHFGSQTRVDAAQLHGGLVSPTGYPNVLRGGYGRYRVQVDFMGHELTGGKNLIYLMDALWCTDDAMSYPKKFFMQPFNHDWSSSIFVSLDPVAIESVGYDFLRSEFTSERDNSDGAKLYVQMDGVDDYLHQAASSSNWPAGVQYDPENDGTVIGSLGTHEHWNNAIDKQYSRNLGTGDGIELNSDYTTPLAVELSSFTGRVVNNEIVLRWNTITEENSYGFELEKKLNSDNAIWNTEWNKIAFIKGYGNSNSPREYSFVDKNVTPSCEYLYRLKMIDLDGSIQYSNIVKVNRAAPERFYLSQNYPNPFNPSTRIEFSVPRSTFVTLKVFNLLGEEIATLAAQDFKAGTFTVDWNAKGVASGVYRYRLVAGSFVETRKMLLLR
jgi:hypothetical protein